MLRQGEGGLASRHEFGGVRRIQIELLVVFMREFGTFCFEGKKTLHLNNVIAIKKYEQLTKFSERYFSCDCNENYRLFHDPRPRNWCAQVFVFPAVDDSPVPGLNRSYTS